MVELNDAREVFLPYVLDHQRPILASPRRFKVVICGRRWGKTILGLIACVAGHGPDFKFRGALQGAQLRWIAPTYPIATSIWKALKASLWKAWSHKDEVERTITLPGSGGSVTVRSADNPDSLRGVGSDGVVIDEAAFCKLEAWEEGIRPTLLDSGGWAIFITTPQGYNWVFDLFIAAQQDESGEWQAWQMPTSDNPRIPAAEIESARRKSAEFRFKQEYLAQFVAPGIGFFRRENWQFLDMVPQGPRRIVRAWDFASSRVKSRGGKKLEPDYTAGIRMSKLLDGRYVIEDARRMRGTPGDREKYIQTTRQFDGPIRLRIPQDPGSAGIDVRDHYIKDVLVGNRVISEPITGDKTRRAEPLAAMQQIGNVYLIRNGIWVPDFLSEADMFPEGDFDDQIDAASDAFEDLTSPTAGTLPTSELDRRVEKALEGMAPTNGSDTKERRFLKTDDATDLFR